MDQNVADKIVDIQRQAGIDRAYRKLLEEYRDKSKRLLELYAALDKSQTAVIMDYLGVCISMHLRLLELACGDLPEK